MGQETITVTRCDRCNAVIEEYMDDTIKLFKSTTVNILKIYVRCWDRHDRIYLCKNCYNKLREFLNEYKEG